MARPPHEDPEYQRQNGFYRYFYYISYELLLITKHISRQQCIIKSPSNNSQNLNFQKNPTSPLVHHNYNSNAYNNPKTPSYNHHSSPVSPTKHARYSPRPSTSAPYPSPTSYVHHSNSNSSQQYLTGYHTQNVSITSSSMSSLNSRMPTTIHSNNCSPTNNANRSPQSPNRRPRGESKKCRKVYGMDRKGEWCTQCKWKKACSRFSDWNRLKSSGDDYPYPKHMKFNAAAAAAEKIIKSLANKLPPTTTVTAATRTELQY